MTRNCFVCNNAKTCDELAWVFKCRCICLENGCGICNECYTQKGNRVFKYLDASIRRCLNKVHEYKDDIDDEAIKNNPLRNACRVGDLAQVKTLYDQGVDVTADFNWPLEIAVGSNHVDIARFLTSLPGVEISDPHTSVDGAIQRGEIEMLEYLFSLDNVAKNRSIFQQALNAAQKYKRGKIFDWLFDQVPRLQKTWA